MRWLGWSLVVLAGCGPTVSLPDGGADGTESDDDDDDDGPGAEDTGAPDDGSGDGEDSCATTPSIRAIQYYAGAAQRTVGRDLLRGEDGTLYMAGSMADAANVGLWIAATAEDGTVVWEAFELLEPGANLRSAPTVEDLTWQQDRLAFAGWADGGGLGGTSNVGGEYSMVVPADFEGLYPYGIAWSSPEVAFYVGQSSEAAFLLRRDDAVVTWQITGLLAEAITQANDTLLSGIDLYVAGQRSDVPWLGRFDIDSTEETLSAVVEGGTTFEPEGGEFSALASNGDAIVTVGSIRHDKPKPDGSTGSFVYNEPFARAWARDGTPVWTWQPSPTTIRPGALHAVTMGPDDTAFFAGYDAEFDDEDGPLVGALDASGSLVWSLPAEEFGPELQYFHANGIALGNPGQLFVLVSSQRLNNETTAIVEICY